MPGAFFENAEPTTTVNGGLVIKRMSRRKGVGSWKIFAYPEPNLYPNRKIFVSVRSRTDNSS
uniref:Uncharacterized protein n=1 Tax=Meloidogyne incognita TaxID=6306 RepID=A0A914N1B9_MELIC